MSNQQQRIGFWILLALLVLILVRTAWVSDDAYITFRTVDNFTHGYGLTWNTGERVQAYTHPLWMLVLSGLYIFIHEIHYTNVILAIAITLSAVALLGRRIASAPSLALLGGTILIFSKAFIDYSTSGLENPLTHLLLAVFLWIYFAREASPRTTGLLALVAALIALNRMDAILLVLPALLTVMARSRRFSAIGWGALGSAPLAAWIIFSIIYYGFPFPNTAYAKLNFNVPPRQVIEQGWYYLLHSIDFDPLTPLAVAGGLLSPLLARRWRQTPVALGILLYLIYIVKIGGDFMGGRFLAAPVFCATALLMQCKPLSLARAGYWPLIFTVLVGYCGYKTPILSNSRYGGPKEGWAFGDDRLIADERSWYFQGTSMMKARQEVHEPTHNWAAEGAQARQRGRHVVKRGVIGLFGYYAGPQVHIVDPLALADALLARLKAPPTTRWRPGHITREVPRGYLESIETGRVQISDRCIAAYYRRLKAVINGPIWSARRWREIWRLNTGVYDPWIRLKPGEAAPRLTYWLDDLAERRAEGTPLSDSGLVQFDREGMLIETGKVVTAPKVEVSLGNMNGYVIRFLRGEQELARAQVNAVTQDPTAQLRVRKVEIPVALAREGYDRIEIVPTDHRILGRLGHVVLMHS